jgi:ankyrin repeat protein
MAYSGSVSGFNSQHSMVSRELGEDDIGVFLEFVTPIFVSSIIQSLFKKGDHEGVNTLFSDGEKAKTYFSTQENIPMVTTSFIQATEQTNAHTEELNDPSKAQEIARVFLSKVSQQYKNGFVFYEGDTEQVIYKCIKTYVENCTLDQLALTDQKKTIIQLLCKKGARLEQTIFTCPSAILKNLIEIGVLPQENPNNARGLTILQQVLCTPYVQDRFAKLMVLLENGYQLTTFDKKNNTTTIHILTREFFKIFFQLSKTPYFKQLNPNISDGTGATLLHLAAIKGRSEIVQAMIQTAFVTPLAINQIDQWGHTAMHHACILVRKAVFDLLYQAGARLDITNKQGRTPLELIQWNISRYDLTTLLQKNCLINPARASLANFNHIVDVEENAIQVNRQPLLAESSVLEKNRVRLIEAIQKKWEEIMIVSPSQKAEKIQADIACLDEQAQQFTDCVSLIEQLLAERQILQTFIREKTGLSSTLKDNRSLSWETPRLDTTLKEQLQLMKQLAECNNPAAFEKFFEKTTQSAKKRKAGKQNREKATVTPDAQAILGKLRDTLFNPTLVYELPEGLKSYVIYTILEASLSLDTAIPITTLLVRKKADPSAILWIKNPNIPLQPLLEKFSHAINPNLTNSADNHALLTAVYLQDIPRIELLLATTFKQAIQYDHRNTAGYNALDIACAYGNLEIVRLLSRQGMRDTPNATDKYAIDYAKEKNKTLTEKIYYDIGIHPHRDTKAHCNTFSNAQGLPLLNCTTKLEEAISEAAQLVSRFPEDSEFPMALARLQEEHRRLSGETVIEASLKGHQAVKDYLDSLSQLEKLQQKSMIINSLVWEDTQNHFSGTIQRVDDNFQLVKNTSRALLFEITATTLADSTKQAALSTAVESAYVWKKPLVLVNTTEQDDALLLNTVYNTLSLNTDWKANCHALYLQTLFNIKSPKKNEETHQEGPSLPSQSTTGFFNSASIRRQDTYAAVTSNTRKNT